MFFNGRKNNNSGAVGVYENGNRQLIELRDLVKTYETAAGPFTALNDVNLHVDRGEFVAVVGKSGSGKSTLINMVTGIDRPTSGEVLVGDTAVQTLKEGQIAVWRGKNIGIIFQFFQLLPTLTVLENIMLPMDFCNVIPARDRREARSASAGGRSPRRPRPPAPTNSRRPARPWRACRRTSW